MNKNKSTLFRKTNAKWINLPSQPLGEGEAISTNKVRTYSIRIKLDAPHPSPKTATIRNIDGEFVWDRLVTCKGRAEAVSQAGKWFQSLRNTGRKGGVGKVLAGKQTHECVTVDDNWKECLYGSNFNPNYNCNRLLDKETIERVIEDSKGNLKVADSPFVKGQAYPALEWATAKKINTLPIKIAFSTFSDPTKGGMKESLDKAVSRERKKKAENKPSWLDEARTQEAKLLIRRMKSKGILGSRETYTEDILNRLSKSKHAKKSPKPEA
jgi:hypothetical protein